MEEKEMKSNNANGIAFIISLFSGLLVGVVYGLITKKWSELLVILLTSIICGFLIKILLDISLKQLSRKLIREMSVIKDGDFSHLLISKEYGLLEGLASAVNAIMSDIRSLIDGFFNLSLSIVQSSGKVSHAANDASTSIADISKTTDEIAKGASDQAQDAQQSVQLMEKLSEQINFVYKIYNEVAKDTSEINNLNTVGIDSVNTLRSKSEENYNMTEKIFAVVQKLTNTANNIGLFVESIENIAEQTNMLALNAAIEAARAGEAGKGFAVVADEVRTLADQSRKATEEINNLMENINTESQMAIDVMETMKNVSQEQNNAVNKTNDAFNNIANAILSIAGQIRQVNEAVSKMERDKDEVIASIENISSVSEETAAASQEVAATTESQLKTVEEMQIAATDLSELVSQLDKRLKKYKLR